MHLSLRLLLPIVLTVSIAVMVGIIVKLQHDTDADILHHIALGNTLAYAQKFENEVENFLNVPAEQVAAIQDAVRQVTPALPLPSMARTQNDIEQWKQLAYRPLLHQNPIYPVGCGIFITNDGSLIRGQILPDGSVQLLLSYFYAPNLGPPFTNFTIELRNLLSLSDYRGNKSMKLGMVDIMRVPIVRKVSAMNPKPRYLFDFGMSAPPPRMQIAFVASLYNSTGDYIGITSIPFDITNIGEFLRLHNNDAAAFIIVPRENASETELVVGTPSEPTVSFDIFNVSANITVPKNCLTSGGIEASKVLGCRRLVTEYPYAPLKASLPYLSLSSCLAMPVEGVTHMMHHNNREYAVVIRRISILADQTPDALFTMIVFYDLTTVQKEVNDRLQKSLWICVGVSLALALLLSGFSQWALSPLSRLVKCLASASLLQSRTRSDRRSRIKEFRDLEDAFIHLHDSLNRLKSRIPPNLLVSMPIQRHAEEPTSRPDVLMTNDKHLEISRLMEQINTFRSTDVSVMIVQCAVSQATSEMAAQASVISRTVIEAAERYNGIVENLYPSKCIVSFNAHSPCPAHQEQAALCAVRTHRNLVQFLPELLHFIFVDTAVHAVGPCGFGESTSRIIIGPSVELAHSVFRLMRSYLVQSRVLLTDHAARVIRSFALVPVDVIARTQSVEEGTRVVLYEPCVRVVFTSQMRDIFVTMMQGHFANARAAIETAIKNNPAFAAHLKRWMENCEHFTKTGTSALERKNAPQWDAMENPLAVQAIEKHSAATKVHEYAAEVLKPKEFEEGGLFGIVAIDEDDTEIPRRVSDVQGTEWLRSLSRIGEGSFSSVYRGISNAGSWSAMKFVRLESEADVLRIGNELQVLTSLIHPNVAQFISYAMHGSFIVMISEFLPDTLSEEIKQFGVPFPDRLLCIAYDILKGLEYIHHRGIVHCDLKPANVLISDEGTCKLCDFGSSLQGAAASCSDVTELRGSAVYMAPEVAQGHAPTCAADVWSFGITLLKVLNVDLRSYEGSGGGMMSEAILIKKIATGAAPIPSPSFWENASVNEEVRKLVEACLERDPSKRATVAQLLANPCFLWGMNQTNSK